MDNIMERVTIGANFSQQPTWKKIVGIPLIYFPLITTTPFVLLGVLNEASREGKSDSAE
jgi:hypothetical protein